MPDASNQTYSPIDPKDYSKPVRETDAALDELASHQQRGLYDAYDAVGGQTVNGSASTVNIDTERTKSSATVFVISGDERTVNLTGGGFIDFSWQVTIGKTGSGDFRFDIFPEQAPSSTGLLCEVTGPRGGGGEGQVYGTCGCGQGRTLVVASSSTGTARMSARSMWRRGLVRPRGRYALFRNVDTRHAAHRRLQHSSRGNL